MNGFEGNCFGLWRGNGCYMKNSLNVGACLIVFSVVVLFICQDTALNPFVRFTTTSLSANGSSKESCLSRNQSVLYLKSSPHKPSSLLGAKLKSYEELHKQCGPHTESYRRSIKQLKSGRIDNSSDCKYMVSVTKGGLGNRILSITSAFLYGLLTNRVLLIDQEHSMANLFCEPFPNTSWLLPEDCPVKNKFNRLGRKYGHSYGNMLKSNAINYSPEVLPSYQFLYLSGDADYHDKLFFCDQDQALLSAIPWLIIKSDLYFIPSLFMTFEQELSKLFPDKVTVFHHLVRYLFHPSDQVWGLITRYYHDYFAKAEKRIGIQIRIFNVKTSPFEYVMDQILTCTQQEKLLPEVDTKTSIASTSKNQTNKAVLITSLHQGYGERLKRMYGEHPTKTGEVVAVYQPSHVWRQRTYSNSHNMQAWAEIYLLSLSDELVTSAGSTFGYVAQGLRGITPLILYKIERKKPDPPCGRAMSMEPCCHKPSFYDCKAKTDVDPATLAPYLRRCEDISWGMKLVNSSR